MKRTPIDRRVLPGYPAAVERANLITHIIGAALGITVLIAAALISLDTGDAWALASGSLYGVSMITLYTVSSVYHGLSESRAGHAKRVMQVIDHCTIFFLIAGTYTPILLVALRPEYPALSWAIFAAEWIISAAAVVFTAIDHKKYAVLSMVCYILLGWLIVFVLEKVVYTVGKTGFLWLLAGGVSYTAGAALYVAGRKKPALHTVFHCFVVLGSALQAVCVLRFVM